MAYIYRGAGGQPPPPQDISVGKFKLIRKFEGGYLTIFGLLRSQKTFRTRNTKN